MISKEALTHLVLCRHGQVDNPNQIIYNSTVDVHLSHAGQLQMQESAYQLQRQGITPDVIYSSPLSRAVESAQIINRVYDNKIPLYQEKDLEDDRSPGLSDQPLALLKEIHTQGYDSYDAPQFEGLEREKKVDLVKRLQECMLKILRKHAGKTILVIVHGDPSALWLWTQINPDEALPKISELEKQGMYLEKGQAWVLLYDNKQHLVSSPELKSKH